MPLKVEMFNTRRWLDTGLRFATEAEARMYTADMQERGATYTRVTHVDGPVNARWAGKGPAEFIPKEIK